MVNYFAGIYATESASNPVTDIVLNNIRVFDIDGMYVYGSIIFWIFIILLCLFRPNRIPFTTKSVAVFTLIRSLFISITHIGPFPTRIVVDSNILAKFTFAGDLFFSAHTGLPFLMALLFWDDIRLRILFITSAILFGVIVLMAHLHYSIDVLSAFFITYTIFHISIRVFPKDYQAFLRGFVESEA